MTGKRSFRKRLKRMKMMRSKMVKYRRKNIKWWVRLFSYGVFFGLIIFFAYHNMSFLRKGVELEASLTKATDSPLYIVEGKAPRAKHLKLNGREIFIDREGNFREVLIPLAGYSIISLYAEDRYGKITEKEFKIYIEKDSPTLS